MTPSQVARMVEHTQLRATATRNDLTALCQEAAQHGFHAVAINPAWASFCARQLAGTGVGLAVTIGFPLGANTAHIKVEEARDAVRNGATELDMVINIGALRSGYPGYVEREIAAVVRAVRGVPVKVILETGYLDRDQKIAVCQMAARSRAAFVKTATGYGNAGATVEDVALMREVVGDKLGVKAAGGIRTYGDLEALLEAGANRFGTSAAVAILQDMREA